MKRACLLGAVALLALRCTQPDTRSSFERSATIHILAKTDGRTPTGPVPLVLEATFDSQQAGFVCVGLAASPGSAVFPFGMGVPVYGGVAGAPSSAGGAPSADAGLPESPFSTAFAWATIDKPGLAEALGSYLPKGEEPSATIFAALYLDGCGGKIAAQSSITVRLIAPAADAGADASSNAGAAGEPGVAGAPADAGSTSGGVPAQGGSATGGTAGAAPGGGGRLPGDAGAAGAAGGP